MKVKTYIRFGTDPKYLDVETLSKEQRKRIGDMLNRQAANAVVLKPKRS